MTKYGPGDIVQIVPPPSVNTTVDQMVRAYLAQNGMVAIDRQLAEALASTTGRLVYHPDEDCFRAVRS